MSADLFRNRFVQMIDLRHSLMVLANRLPRQELEASWEHRFARPVRVDEDMDLFCPSASVIDSHSAMNWSTRSIKHLRNGRRLRSEFRNHPSLNFLPL